MKHAQVVQGIYPNPTRIPRSNQEVVLEDVVKGVGQLEAGHSCRCTCQVRPLIAKGGHNLIALILRNTHACLHPHSTTACLRDELQDGTCLLGGIFWRILCVKSKHCLGDTMHVADMYHHALLLCYVSWIWLALDHPPMVQGTLVSDLAKEPNLQLSSLIRLVDRGQSLVAIAAHAQSHIAWRGSLVSLRQLHIGAGRAVPSRLQILCCRLAPRPIIFPATPQLIPLNTKYIFFLWSAPCCTVYNCPLCTGLVPS